MSDLLMAIFLGIVEGLTEFIPVSSTAHLVLLVDGLGFPAPPGRIFEVFIQLGAILAVVVLYWKKFWVTATTFHKDRIARNFLYCLIAGTIPAIIVGGLGRDWIKANLYNSDVIAASLIIGGIIILVFERFLIKPKIESVDDVPVKTAFIVGIFQSIALIPGVSRSGATIIGGLSVGLSRKAAAEFSFFLAVPVMFAAVTYDLIKSWDILLAYEGTHLILAGFLAAFVTAMMVLKVAMHIISRYGFAPFAWYRIALGLTIIAIMN